MSKRTASLATELAESHKQLHLEQQRAWELASRFAENEQHREELANAAGKLEGLGHLDQLNAVLEAKQAAQSG